MTRRAFTAALATVLVAPRVAAGQQPRRTARVGLLLPTAAAAATTGPGTTRSLPLRLRELGWIEGANLIMEMRFADNRPERLPSLAAELVRMNVDVIVAVSPPAITAAKHATSTIPVVMAFSGIDPVKAGFVRSLARPGGNVTGLTILATDMAVKRLQVLKEARPSAARVAVLVNPKNPSGTLDQLTALRAVAPALAVHLEPLELTRSGEYAALFDRIARLRPDALLVSSDPEFFRDRLVLVELVARSRIPASYEWREFVEAGGFMSYGPNLADVGARVALYVDRLLKGATPADLPVEQPTKFELAINVKTAKALGLVIPPSLLLRTDIVVE